jgi:hypothetical protein
MEEPVPTRVHPTAPTIPYEAGPRPSRPTRCTQRRGLARTNRRGIRTHTRRRRRIRIHRHRHTRTARRRSTAPLPPHIIRRRGSRPHRNGRTRTYPCNPTAPTIPYEAGPRPIRPTRCTQSRGLAHTNRRRIRTRTRRAVELVFTVTDSDWAGPLPQALEGVTVKVPDVAEAEKFPVIACVPAHSLS